MCFSILLRYKLKITKNENYQEAIYLKKVLGAAKDIGKNSILTKVLFRR